MSSNKITLAQIRWSDEGVPFSTEFDDYYFSTDDGLTEIEHNFIKPNHLLSRFTATAEQQTFRLVETGFGSGLNFIKTVALWLEVAPRQAQLHFISFEKHPMSLDDLSQVHRLLPENENPLIDIAAELRQHYPVLLPGWHDVYLFDKRIRLTLWLGDVLKGLSELSTNNLVDAWFLDGFAPAKNPQMWQPGLYQQMARLSHLESTFSTFTAAGDVRRNLMKVGFKVEKSTGFGKKREVCFGQLAQQRSHSLKAPWFARPLALDLEKSAKKAIIVGAGLAGAAVAYKLAVEGWQVAVLEAEHDCATQASGNLAGTVHPLITADWNLRSQWYLLGFKHTLQSTLPWLETAGWNHQEEQIEPSKMGDLTGLLELLVDKKAQDRIEQAMLRVGLPKDWVKLLSAEQASEVLGTQTPFSALLFEQGGWLYPKAVVQQCLSHPNIKLHKQSKVIDFCQLKDSSKLQLHWQVKTIKETHRAPVLVVATGSLEATLNKRLGLPIRPVKGQVTNLRNDQQQQILNKAVTHEGYSVSMPNGAVTGATFEAPDMTQSLSGDGHLHNLSMTSKSLPNWIDKSTKTKDVVGRVAFRPTTSDHLPIVGPVACEYWMAEKYLTQSHTRSVYRYAV